MSRFFHYLTCSLLLMTGWIHAFSQGTPTTSPAQRLNLELVNNQSTFVIDEENGNRNEYTNTFRLTQPETYKLTAGMLNEGDNFITLSRQGDTETEPSEVARINLNTNIVKREAEILTDIELTSTSLNETGWSVSNARNTLTYSNTYGCCRINSGYDITYTIPQGYDGGTILLNIGTYTQGYFKINNGSAQQARANSWNQYILTGLNGGSTIQIRGCNSSGSNANSPYIAGIYIIWAPPTIVPTINVTSTYSQKQGSSWVNVSSLGSYTYTPNDDINANNLNVDLTDSFNELIENSNCSSCYNYSLSMDANIDWADMTGDFYASVDFTKGDGDELTTPEYIGPNNWDYMLVAYYIPTNGSIPALYLDASSDFIYTMPNTFAGNTVNVTVTSTNNNLGVGYLVVNGDSYNFAAGESHTWTVPVSANGVIRFQNATGENYTCDIAKITIQSGNGSASNAPQSQFVAPNLKQKANNNFLNGKDYNIQTKKMSAKK